MARESWAKLHVELLDDEKLCTRSDSDFKLWVCLILLAKQTTEDGVIHKMGAAALRDRFSLQCAPRHVQAALDHFAKSGMVELAPTSIRILNYDKRQTVKDFHEQNAERQRKWRERNATSNGDAALRETLPEEIRREEKRSSPKPPPGAFPLRGSKKRPSPTAVLDPEKLDAEDRAAVIAALDGKHG